jgi:CRP-like cAMP-binding protein
VAAAIVKATEASGVIVRGDVQSFREILERSPDGLVVHARAGFLTKHHRYLTSYKGLAFFTQTPKELSLSPTTEIVEADKIWIPD